jgi:membrane protease YdiL (CAAX protease family)
MVDHVTPIIIFAIYASLFAFRNRIFKRVPEGRQGFVREVSSCCVLRINTLWRSVLLPIVAVNLIYFTMLCVLGAEVVKPELTVFGNFVSVIFIPFSEELIMRGLFLGFAFVALPAYLFRVKNREYPLLLRLVILSIGITFTSLLFVFQHDPLNYLRYFSSILFCLVYLYDKRNLTPAIIAHSTSNIIINFVTGC